MTGQPIDQFSPTGVEVRVEILDGDNTVHIGIANYTPYLRHGAGPEDYRTVREAISSAADEVFRVYLQSMFGADTGG